MNLWKSCTQCLNGISRLHAIRIAISMVFRSFHCLNFVFKLLSFICKTNSIQNTYTKSHRNLCLSDLLVNSSCFGRTWTRVLHFHRVVRLIWIYYATVSLDILMFTRIVVHDIDFAIQNLCMIFLVYSFDLFSMIIFKMNYFREFKSETTTVCQHC